MPKSKVVPVDKIAAARTRPRTTVSGMVGTGVGLVALTVAGAAGYLQTRHVHAESPRPADRPPLASQVPSIPAPPGASPQRALLDKYCVTCHNQRLLTAGLPLDTLDVARIGEEAPVWEKVVRKLRTGAMPPAGMPRPAKVASDGLAEHVERALDQASAAHLNPGRPAVHRLNRTEYANAVRDLLALEIDVASLLPADDSTYGFDNIGDLLSISPGLFERYLLAGKRISRLAVGDMSLDPVAATYTTPKLLLQHDRMSEELPFGSRGGVAIRHHFPLDGEYVLKFELQKRSADPVDVRVDGARVGLLDPNQPLGDGYPSAWTEVRFVAKAGTRLVGVAFQQRTVAPDGVAPARVPGFGLGGGGQNGVTQVEIAGPFNPTGSGDTPSRRQIFVCHPTSPQAETPCARTILSTLARRAYRRPVAAGEVDELLGFYTVGRREGRSFDAGIQRALERLLVGPDFLFRIELDPANVAPATAYRLSDLDLASRLSFFLWSSIPDDELLQLAEKGRLKDAAVLEQQVRRMLADTRAATLVSNFAAQWLYQRNLRSATPDFYEFPTFDDNLREDFRRETELFLETELREDRSVVELLSADYTFVNERLARHYGIPNIYGSHFRRVTFPGDDRTRGGLLGQGSILTVTSYPHRTSVVLRGKWLLDNILGTPPPAPPADVPPLEENEGKLQPKSLRERMEQHRANPVCASCHARMDPLGFALENFDAIGRWRTTDAGTLIDPAGVLPDGTKVNGPADLRRVFLSRRQDFVTTLAEKLLTYAMGRGIEYYDQPAIRHILRGAAGSEYRWSAIILGIVKSAPFQMRRSA